MTEHAAPVAASKTITVSAELLRDTLQCLTERPAKEVYMALRALDMAPKAPDGAAGLLPESALPVVINALSVLPINQGFDVFCRWLSAASEAGCPVMVQDASGVRPLDLPVLAPPAAPTKSPESPAVPNGSPRLADSYPR